MDDAAPLRVLLCQFDELETGLLEAPVKLIEDFFRPADTFEGFEQLGIFLLLSLLACVYLSEFLDLGHRVEGRVLLGEAGRIVLHIIQISANFFKVGLGVGW